jgi:hypothetical protein
MRRVKDMDPDNRPRPRTSRFCVMCHKDISTGDRNARVVRVDPLNRRHRGFLSCWCWDCEENTRGNHALF